MEIYASWDDSAGTHELGDFEFWESQELAKQELALRELPGFSPPPAPDELLAWITDLDEDPRVQLLVLLDRAGDEKEDTFIRLSPVVVHYREQARHEH